MESRILSAEGARAAGVDRPWEQGNEAWWDWYLSLADADAGPPAELVAVDPPPAAGLPDPAALAAELAAPYALDEHQIARFRSEGHVKLPGVLSPGALAVARGEVDRLAAAGSGPGRSGFLSLDSMWLESDVLRAFALSPRLGRLAADLLGAADVRLYHDNVLSKSPGCGRTPWHFDAHHFPIASRDVVTSWIPLQAVPRAMGPLSFARGIDVWKLVDGIDFAAEGDGYDRAVGEALRAHGVLVEDGPFALGEVSFHHSLAFHAAGANGTTSHRSVMATTYFADGARVVDAPTMVSGDWQKFMPGARAGEPITTPLNPVVSRPA
jgi:hypothetical protein